MKKYRLVKDLEGKDHEEGILCLKCGYTSYHPKDVAERYCGYCHTFLDAPASPHLKQILRTSIFWTALSTLYLGTAVWTRSLPLLGLGLIVATAAGLGFYSHSRRGGKQASVSRAHR